MTNTIENTITTDDLEVLKGLPIGTEITDDDGDTWTIAEGGVMSTWGNNFHYDWDHFETSFLAGDTRGWGTFAFTAPTEPLVVTVEDVEGLDALPEGAIVQEFGTSEEGWRFRKEDGKWRFTWGNRNHVAADSLLRTARRVLELVNPEILGAEVETRVDKFQPGDRVVVTGTDYAGADKQPGAVGTVVRRRYYSGDDRYEVDLDNREMDRLWAFREYQLEPLEEAGSVDADDLFDNDEALADWERELMGEAPEVDSDDKAEPTRPVDAKVGVTIVNNYYSVAEVEKIVEVEATPPVVLDEEGLDALPACSVVVPEGGWIPRVLGWDGKWNAHNFDTDSTFIDEQTRAFARRGEPLVVVYMGEG